jgi:hypothetical protein
VKFVVVVPRLEVPPPLLPTLDIREGMALSVPISIVLIGVTNTSSRIIIMTMVIRMPRLRPITSPDLEPIKTIFNHPIRYRVVAILNA